jgi:hypothetical protein
LQKLRHVVTRVDICYITEVEAVKVESRFLLCNLLYSVRVSVEYDESQFLSNSTGALLSKSICLTRTPILDLTFLFLLQSSELHSAVASFFMA